TNLAAQEIQPLGCGSAEDAQVSRACSRQKRQSNRIHSAMRLEERQRHLSCPRTLSPIEQRALLATRLSTLKHLCAFCARDRTAFLPSGERCHRRRHLGNNGWILRVFVSSCL